MNTFKLIRLNMARKRIRSVLLVLSIAIAFFIYALLASFEHGFKGADSTSERLVVSAKAGAAQLLPISALDRIAQLPEVATVTYRSNFRATYNDPKNFMGANAVDPSSYAAYFEGQYNFGDGQIAALETQRDGLLVGAAIAQREGWKVGDRIVLNSPFERKLDGTRNWQFQIAGIFEGTGPAIDTNFVIMRYDYFNLGRQNNQDTVANFGILPAPGVTADQVIAAVDARFANSAHETQTRTENDFMKAFVEQFADVTTIVQLVVGAAFVTILMIVANTMFFAIRERTLEIGVLKVLGFSGGYIMRAVLAETLWIFAIGVTLGIGAAYGAGIVLSGPLSTIVPSLALTPAIIINATLLALVFSLLTGGLPAINAMRIPTTAALKGA
ncbi:MAG: FtsX-like permease family protein [Sulfitobacter sp.]